MKNVNKKILKGENKKENVKTKKTNGLPKKDNAKEKNNENIDKILILGLTLKMQKYAYKMDLEWEETKFNSNHKNPNKIKEEFEKDKIKNYNNFRVLFYKLLGKPGENSIFDSEEKFKYFSILANFCIQRFNENILTELFKIYEKLIKHNVFSESEKGYMHLETYRNIVKVSTSLGKYNWLKKFHKKCSHLLHPDYINEMGRLTESYILFSEKKFLESLEKIDGLNINFTISETDMRHQKLKLYFELYSFDKNDLENTQSFAKYNYIFLSGLKEFPKESKELYKLFVNYYFHLLEYKSKPKSFYSTENLEYIKLQTIIEKAKDKIKDELNKKTDNLNKNYSKFIDKNTKISEVNKELYRLFLKYYKDLFKIKSNLKDRYQIEALELIRKKIKSENKLVQKKWLLEKIEEMLENQKRINT